MSEEIHHQPSAVVIRILLNIEEHRRESETNKTYKFLMFWCYFTLIVHLLYQLNITVYFQVYYFIKTQSEWKRSLGNVKVSLLCMADGFEDGTFVGIMYSVSKT